MKTCGRKSLPTCVCMRRKYALRHKDSISLKAVLKPMPQERSALGAFVKTDYIVKTKCIYSDYKYLIFNNNI